METPLIVISSSKAGVGKTTLAFNLATALIQDGYAVGVYSDKARDFLQKRLELSAKNPTIKMPEEINQDNLFGADFRDCNVVIVDVPTNQNENFLPIFSKAHTLITVVQSETDINWQFSDSYLNMIWQAKKNQAAAGVKCLNWVVMENKMKTDSKEFENQLKVQSRRFGFRCSPALEKREAYTQVKDGYGAADLVHSKTLKMAMEDVYARRELLILADFMWQHK